MEDSFLIRHYREVYKISQSQAEIIYFIGKATEGQNGKLDPMNPETYKILNSWIDDRDKLYGLISLIWANSQSLSFGKAFIHLCLYQPKEAKDYIKIYSILARV
jgi:hypothetical protein